MRYSKYIIEFVKVTFKAFPYLKYYKCLFSIVQIILLYENYLDKMKKVIDINTKI